MKTKEDKKIYMREYRKKISQDKKKEILNKQNIYYKKWYKENKEKVLHKNKLWRAKQKENNTQNKINNIIN